MKNQEEQGKANNRMTIRFPEDSRKDLRRLAKEVGIDDSKFVREIIQMFISEFKKPGIPKVWPQTIKLGTIYPTTEDAPVPAVMESGNRDKLEDRLEHLEEMVGELLEKTPKEGAA